MSIPLAALLLWRVLITRPQPHKPRKEKPVINNDKIEQISYKLNYKGIKVGKATMVLYPDADLDGQKVILITFETDTAFFDDFEKIYIEQGTYLPIRVERKISQFGKHYFIREEYNQADFTVRIYKETDKVVTIARKQSIQNPMSMIYYVRMLRNLEKGKEIPIVLPMIEIKTRFEGIENVKLPAGKFSAFLFKSIPDKFSFWLSNDEHRLPLKLEVPGAIGYSALMTEVKYIDYDKFMQPLVEDRGMLKKIAGIVPNALKNLYVGVKDRIGSVFRFGRRNRN